ncbi:SLC5A9 [Bugula neritina]|uniref:SLC5A9 n=1 Tax=Bugula neritina TaxID=10212 RepID=A0A7J7KL61_BUGNE|nr:SLC5A9 [Bugula neritina]
MRTRLLSQYSRVPNDLVSTQDYLVSHWVLIKSPEVVSYYVYTLPSQPGEGLRGFFLGVMLASLASSMTSVFNSSCTIICVDIWKKVRPLAQNKELMIVGRVSILLMVAASTLWVLVLDLLENFDDFFHSIQRLTAFFTPPITAVFLTALFWKRTTEKGAFYGLMIGTVTGLIRLILETSYPSPKCSEDTRPDILKNFHYLYFCTCLFVLSLLTIVLPKLMFQTRKGKSGQKKQKGKFEVENLNLSETTTDETSGKTKTKRVSFIDVKLNSAVSTSTEFNGSENFEDVTINNLDSPPSCEQTTSRNTGSS